MRLQTGIAAVKSYGNHDGDGGLVPGIRAISRCALAKQHEEVFLEGRAAPVAGGGVDSADRPAVTGALGTPRRMLSVCSFASRQS